MKTTREYKRIICETYCAKVNNSAACSTCFVRSNLTNNFELSKEAEDLISLGVLADGGCLLKLYHDESLKDFRKAFGLGTIEDDAPTEQTAGTQAVMGTPL